MTPVNSSISTISNYRLHTNRIRTSLCWPETYSTWTIPRSGWSRKPYVCCESTATATGISTFVYLRIRTGTSPTRTCLEQWSEESLESWHRRRWGRRHSVVAGNFVFVEEPISEIRQKYLSSWCHAYRHRDSNFRKLSIVLRSPFTIQDNSNFETDKKK